MGAGPQRPGAPLIRVFWTDGPPFSAQYIRNCLSPLNQGGGRVARPIAKRRAGLLGRVAPANGGINSLVLASGCCPVRFDLDHSLFSGQIAMKAAP